MTIREMAKPWDEMSLTERLSAYPEVGCPKFQGRIPHTWADASDPCPVSGEYHRGVCSCCEEPLVKSECWPGYIPERHMCQCSEPKC